jgi:hypothetical protein
MSERMKELKLESEEEINCVNAKIEEKENDIKLEEEEIAKLCLSQ